MKLRGEINKITPQAIQLIARKRQFCHFLLFQNKKVWMGKEVIGFSRNVMTKPSFQFTRGSE